MRGSRESHRRARTLIADGVESVILAALLALIPLRAVLSEIHTFEVPRGLQWVEAPPTASPATTFAIIAFITAASGAVLFLRVASPTRPLRATGAERGAIILLAAMAWSTLHAGQKHLALIASLDTAAAILYGLILRQLLDSPMRLRLTMTVLLATGVMLLGKCAYQRWVEWPDTLEYYRLHKAELLAQGRSSEGFIHDYEKRLESGAVSAFFHHPNVLASYLLLVIFAALALVGRAVRHHGRLALSRLGPWLIAIAASTALLAAQSKGALAALGLGLLLWVIARAGREPIRRHPRTAVLILWTTLALLAVTLIATLSIRPDALGRSMLFRWFYWKGAAALIADQGLAGIGGENFGRCFTRYKPPECPEDVEDPHSWVVRSLVDWGVIGLIGLLAVFLGVSLRVARSRNPGVERSSRPSTSSHDVVIGSSVPRPRPSMILWSAAIAAIFMAGWYAVLHEGRASFLLLTFHVPLVGWFIGFFLASPRSAVEDEAGAPFVDGSAPALLTPIAAGLVAFLLHSGIDLALFLGGPATAFFALLAVLLAAAEDHAVDPPAIPAAARLMSAPTKWAAALSGAFMGVASVTLVLTLAFPAARAARGLHAARVPVSARTCTEYAASPPGRAYQRAIAVYPLDATAIDEYVEERSDRVQCVADVDETLTLVSEFERRDPRNASVAQHRATLYYQRFALATANSPPTRESLEDLDRALEHMRRSVDAYPSHPSRRIHLADLFIARAVAANRPQDRLKAADELEKAMELDAQRIYISAPHRFTESMRESLRRRIAELRAASWNPSPRG